MGRANNDARTPERSAKVLNLEPETARSIGIFTRSSRRMRLLEISLFNRYSTIGRTGRRNLFYQSATLEEEVLDGDLVLVASGNLRLREQYYGTMSSTAPLELFYLCTEDSQVEVAG